MKRLFSSFSLSHTPSLVFFYTSLPLSLSLSLSLSFSLFQTHTHTLFISIFLFPSLSYFFPYPLPISLLHLHTISLSIFLLPPLSPSYFFPHPLPISPSLSYLLVLPCKDEDDTYEASSQATKLARLCLNITLLKNAFPTRKHLDRYRVMPQK